MDTVWYVAWKHMPGMNLQMSMSSKADDIMTKEQIIVLIG